jgi:excinuclease ABC subunit A
LLVEHNLEIIKNSDYIIDLGPEAGEKGGEIIGQGTPEELIEIKKSHTGKFLREYLEALNIDKLSKKAKN